MANLYHIENGAISSGPHHPLSDAIKRITNCGNPELLGDMWKYGLVPEVLGPLGANQGYGEPKLAKDGMSVTVQAVDVPPESLPVPRSIPTRLAKLVLLASGKLGASVKTLEQMDAAILALIDGMIPAGLQREGAKAAWMLSTQFELGNATLAAMMVELGITAAERDAMFRQAEAMRAAEVG